MSDPEAPDAEERVVAYHERTKHHYRRYAAGPGDMDWATQPDPFRRFEGSPLIYLPLPPRGRALEYWELYVPGRVAPRPLSLESISLFFRYALALTAWKQIPGTSWSLRANPSSGNLHPTEGYAILPPIEGIDARAALYHYAPKEHALEKRAELDGFEGSGFIVGLSSIHWREAWKYGERAYRYCQHDVGHALGTLRFAAAALGWRLRLVDRISDASIASLLGLDRDGDFGRAEREHPDLLAIVERDALPVVRAVSWFGRANVLSRRHSADWAVIEEVARATTSAGLAFEETLSFADVSAIPPAQKGNCTAEQVILGRRSAVAMDGKTSISASTFYSMLARLLPPNMPWDAIPWRPRIHLGLFVHRVDGLEPGLYFFVRDPSRLAALKTAMAGAFMWQQPNPALPLYLLEKRDVRTLAASVSCHQDIAADGAFSLGMIADYLESLEKYGAPFYRCLFWEAGLLGQILYLEAEEAGIRSTGIGCYFDDPVHEAFGITERDFQSFYHFTVGGPVEDRRLTTLPAYPEDK